MKENEEELSEILSKIKLPFEDVMTSARARVDDLVKPPGSLGKLEDFAVKLSGITGKIKNNINKKCIIIMCADNGIYEEKVSSCPQEVTVSQAINFVRGITGVGVLANNVGSDLKVVDIGMKSIVNYKGIIDRKIRKSTYNIAKGFAMSREEAVKGIMIGIDMVSQVKEEGYSLIGTGEMGICNTSTSSAVLIALTGISINQAVGRGAGLTDEGYENKKKAIAKALSINKPDSKDPIDVLSKVGGFDIAGMVGCFIGGAYYRLPVVIDGFISAVAALIAYRLNPLVKEYIFASHASYEVGYKKAIDSIGLAPMFDLNMRLGEGSGCPIAFSIIEASCAMINNMATFKEAEINDDYLNKIRAVGLEAFEVGIL